MKKIFRNLLFPFIGIASLVWFLVRVIPKPSRAAYPCMRVAAPIASSFVIYLLGLTSSVFFLKKARKYFHETRYVLFLVMLFFGISIFFFTSVHSDKKVYAYSRTSLEGPNQPMGTGKGIYPGRVVWIHNADATDATCANNSSSDYWYLDSNTDQTVVNNMLSDGLQRMTGQTSNSTAWDAIFHYYNQNHGKGDVGYSAGEKIVIKINLNGIGNGYPDDQNINTSPQVCCAILDQLINVAGVAQADITIGDPNKTPNTAMYNKIHNAFANVKIWKRGTTAVQSTNKVFYCSDGGASDYLPQAYLDAAYMINVPVLKKHHRAGISLGSKLHFGSVTPFSGDAFHLHYSLPMPDPTLGSEGWQHPNGDYGVYRCFVDIMGHKDLGGKTILYLVDGLWGSINWGHPPIKWRMAPFNNDWPNSLFLSQDPVAIESVGFDFLFYEFDENHPTEGTLDPWNDTHGPFPHFAGTEDYLHQAADSLNWPTGLHYDPENDGVNLPRSLGTHEHWNNAEEKKYTRNLGGDTGIELVTNIVDAVAADAAASGQEVTDFALLQNYPNPFNATTNIYYTLAKPAQVNLSLHNANGQLVRILVDAYQSTGSHIQKWDGLTASGVSAASGIYFYKIAVRNNNGSTEQVKKMILSK